MMRTDEQIRRSVRDGAQRVDAAQLEVLLDIRRLTDAQSGLLVRLAEALETYLERYAPLRTGRPRKQRAKPA